MTTRLWRRIAAYCGAGIVAACAALMLHAWGGQSAAADQNETQAATQKPPAG